MSRSGDSGQPDWAQYFGFQAPYDDQAAAIESALQAGQSRGFLAMEGPCGTGKTMAALTAGATLIREGDYERLLVVTPVKQQRRQFVEDLRRLNAGLADPLDGLALVGKRDLCPYGREDVFPPDASVQDRCEDLRENTAGLVESDGQSDDRPVGQAAVSPRLDDIWWDPQVASDLTKAARTGGIGQQAVAGALSTAGGESPYRRTQPTAPDEIGGDDPPLYCPFEADWFARNKGSPIGFEAGDENVLTAEEYLPNAVERGTCPHRAMGVLVEAADVVIGNYNHLFDPGSRPLIEGILDERTFVVVDEAHRLEGRVRDLLSDRLGRQTIVQARNDCYQLLSQARQSADHKREVRARLGDHDIPLAVIDRARDFFDDLLGWLDDRIAEFLDAEVGRDWRTDESVFPEGNLEVPLRDPEEPEPDELTRWAEQAGYDGDFWRQLDTVGLAVEETLEALDISRAPVVAAAGMIMRRWWERDHATTFREIELEHAAQDDQRIDGWRDTYTAGLTLFDCLPAQPLARTFDDVGGGVLMSATLEPLDVFTRVAGLDALADGDDGREEHDEGRPVLTRSYGLTFPPENRASWIVDATPFTARNRGDPATMDPLGGEWNATRDEYAHVLRSIARNPGNVLIAMPNYREATWAGAYLDEVVEKAILVDESSSEEATESLKAEFFAGEGKVLVTSTRGTLTEGVDYDGAKLQAAAVVGVPLVNIGSPRVRAVQRAYGDVFGDEQAFEYALTIPAIRRARQAIGRVIRGTDEVGVRALVGARYTPDARHSVYGYLSPAEREEFVQMSPEFLADQIDRFWTER
ncbi:ATP-dependent DNA helicase [Halorhabdus sp. CBA1104]|uniref:ATP-dependent DNA helicase n=1 Tax=Halorhabdus sp. CBA1104 TaxID=1380432 RepID=UPI0012B378F8|nr:ATP-dependent DNA helicase [Halorhabdus sp. CBA1104]QGN07232.1 ATP-dependent DNA helicase [Halorhabdus sp. CBA1104]